MMSVASLRKNLVVAVVAFYLLRLELFCSFLSLPATFLSELRLAWLLPDCPPIPVLALVLVLALELNMEESRSLSWFLLSSEADPWLGFTMMTDLLETALACSLFLEFRWPLPSPTTWLSMIQLLWTIRLFDSWLGYGAFSSFF